MMRPSLEMKFIIFGLFFYYTILIAIYTTFPFICIAKQVLSNKGINSKLYYINSKLYYIPSILIVLPILTNFLSSLRLKIHNFYLNFVLM